jgi:hypothetical protein
MWMNLRDIVFIVWLTSFGSLHLVMWTITVVAAASTLVTIFLLPVFGLLTFALVLVTFLFGLLLSFIILGGHGI